MRLFIPIIFTTVIIAGCSTKDAVNPPGTGGTTPPDTTNGLSHDDFIHLATFKVNPQIVNTSVSGSSLFLKFNENVDLLINDEGYQKTSAVHLIEDFGKSSLSGIDFTTVAEGGNTTLNWVDDNLNNVILKTITDTLVKSVKMVKINIKRPFTFFKSYSSNQEALNQQVVFVNKKNDTITFKSYTYYNQKNYLPTSSSTRVVYVKN